MGVLRPARSICLRHRARAETTNRRGVGSFRYTIRPFWSIDSWAASSTRTTRKPACPSLSEPVSRHARTAGGAAWIYCTVSVALRVVERYVPPIVEEVPCTAPVVTVKVMLFTPAGIVAADGT